jgi:hypothetical protein
MTGGRARRAVRSRNAPPRPSAVAWCVVLLLALALPPTGRAADAATDAYLAGYAGAVLEREFHADAASLRVVGGVVTLDAADLGGADRAQVESALSQIRGVTGVEIREPGGMAPAAAGRGAPRPADAQAPRELAVGFLPGGVLFKSLIADPRWPHFALAYQGYLGEPRLGSVAAVSFGESFMIYRDAIGNGRWEAGIQAGVFSFFDLNAPSKDLVNTDYIVGVVAGYRREQFSALGRLFHQSSHLGDEYIFSNSLRNRVNLSYQAVDLRLSREFFGEALRLCVGGGYIFERQPATLKPLSLQSGLELRSPWPGPGARIRPIAAADIQYREENNWAADVSLRAGLEFQRWLGTRNLQILLEYFRGYSPNGQFYTDRIDYLGLGLHFNF